MLDDIYYMKKALELARKAYEDGEIPVGAVVVDKDGNIIGEGYNEREKLNSPTAHAEITAIETASHTISSWRLSDCTLYVTLEPCPMCCGAIINSRITRVVYGAKDEKAGCCFSKMNMFEFDFNHKPILKSGIMQKECEDILKNFFSTLRK